MAEEKATLPITVMAVFDDKHKGVNEYTSRRLNELGLKEGRDYENYSAPPTLAEVYPVPIIHVNRDNTLGLREEKFFGREGIDVLLDEIKMRRAA